MNEISVNPPTPCRFGKHPPAPENWPAIEERAVEGGRAKQGSGSPPPEGGREVSAGLALGLEDADDNYAITPPTPCLWQASASAKCKTKKENQAGHSSERAVEDLGLERGKWC